jgi:hypothetical protein
MRIVAQERSTTALGFGEEMGKSDEEGGNRVSSAEGGVNRPCERGAAGGIGEGHDDTPGARGNAGGATLCKPPAFLSR